jgi:site-specific recombinase XerC
VSLLFVHCCIILSGISISEDALRLSASFFTRQSIAQQSIRGQALLGHAKLTTTARYASVATGMIAAVDSPLDDLNGAKRKKGKPKPS